MTNEKEVFLPNFMCVGVVKAGTTTLHHALLHHPNIFLPRVKETFFFSSNKYYRRGVPWYLEQHFSGAEMYSFRGEIAPTYFYHSEKVSQRLAALYRERELKLIIIFRDPVARAYSHYWHMRRLGWEKELSFEKALALEKQRKKRVLKKNEANGKDRFAYFESGLYASKLKPFLIEFPKNKILFLLLDDLKYDYDGTISDVLKFIGAPNLHLPYEYRNEARIADNSLTMFWNRGHRSVKAFVRKSIPGGLRSRVTNTLGIHKTRPFKYPRMAAKLEANLRERYKDEIVELAALTDRDLSAWLP